MARVNAPSRLTLKLQTGFDSEKGIPIFKSYSFGNVIASAEDTEMIDLANILADLSSYPLYSVIRTDSAVLEDEEE